MIIQFVSYLKNEEIECSEISMITKSLEASLLLVKGFSQLKTSILSYPFKEENIYFFKETKPKLCSRLIFYRKVYNIKMKFYCYIEITEIPLRIY